MTIALVCLDTTTSKQDECFVAEKVLLRLLLAVVVVVIKKETNMQTDRHKGTMVSGLVHAYMHGEGHMQIGRKDVKASKQAEKEGKRKIL